MSRSFGLASLDEPCMSRHNPQTVGGIRRVVGQPRDLREPIHAQANGSSNVAASTTARRVGALESGYEAVRGEIAEKKRKAATRRGPINRLPVHTFVRIFSYLPMRWVAYCCRVSKPWHLAAVDKELWVQIAEGYNIDNVLIDFREAVKMHLEQDGGGHARRIRRRAQMQSGTENNDLLLDDDDEDIPIPNPRRHRRVTARSYINNLDPSARSNPAKFLPSSSSSAAQHRRPVVELEARSTTIQSELSPERRARKHEEETEAYLRNRLSNRNSNTTTKTSADDDDGASKYSNLPPSVAAVHISFKSSTFGAKGTKKQATLSRPVAQMSVDQELDAVTDAFYRKVPVMTAERKVDLLEKHEQVLHRRTLGLEARNTETFKAVEGLLYDLKLMQKATDDVNGCLAVPVADAIGSSFYNASAASATTAQQQTDTLERNAEQCERDAIANAVLRKRTQLFPSFEQRVCRLIAREAASEGDALARSLLGLSVRNNGGGGDPSDLPAPHLSASTFSCSITTFVQMEMLCLSGSRIGTPLYLAWSNFKRLLPVNDAYYDTMESLCYDVGSFGVEEQFVREHLLSSSSSMISARGSPAQSMDGFSVVASATVRGSSSSAGSELPPLTSDSPVAAWCTAPFVEHVAKLCIQRAHLPSQQSSNDQHLSNSASIGQGEGDKARNAALRLVSTMIRVLQEPEGNSSGSLSAAIQSTKQSGATRSTGGGMSASMMMLTDLLSDAL